ncbi:MAG: hypothetical protein M3362_26390, partial [Acidobacteriota bacterium]|nr:hypothetical protein [Acidobacteriota bacterium]
MKLIGILILIAALLFPQSSYAQKRKFGASSSQIDIVANRAWLPFFAKFRSAVSRRDREALKKMMVPDFHYSS